MTDMAVASKDGSTVTASNLRLENSRVGFAAYQKKAEFSGATLTADCGYRLTIDSNMAFFAVKRYGNRFLNKRLDSVNRIIELKYAPALDDGISRISNEFPFRMTKSSKYIVGIELLYGGDEEIPKYY